MNYHKVNNDTDYQSVKFYCFKKNLNPPDRNSIIFFAKDGNEVIGVCALRTIVQIEPFACESAIAAQVLLEKAFAVASFQTTKVYGLVKSDNVDYLKLVEHSGAVITDRDMVVIERNL